jgi:hypothetical protein
VTPAIGAGGLGDGPGQAGSEAKVCGGKRRLFSVRFDQAASLRVASSKNVRALEWTCCFSASLIIPALWRQSAFMVIRAADATSLIGKINSMSRCMAE